MNLFFNSAAFDQASALARSQTNNTPAAKPTFVLGDNPEINIYVTDGEGGFDASSGDATVTPSLGIGTPGAGPSGGTFWLGVSTATSGSLTTAKRYQIETYVAGDDFANLGATENATGVVFTSSGTTPSDWTNGSTLIEITTDVSYAASAATLEAALEATAAVVGVNVTKASAAPNFVVEWDSVGAVAMLVGGPSSLTPASAVVTSELQAGSASAVEKQVVRLTRQPYALQTVWSTIADGWSARLDCNTRGLLDLLGGSVSAGSTLELQLVDASQNVRTVGQVDCLIRNEAIDEASTIPTPFPSYLNAAQIGQSFVQNRFEVTALDGGGTALDGIPTGTTALPTVPTDALVAIELSGALSFYQLVSGTDVQSLPDVVRPNDYAASTNERVWKLRGTDSSTPTDTDTVAWRSSQLADAPLFGAPNIVPALHVSYDVAFPPSVSTDTVTVLGVVGERYLVRAHVVGVSEIAAFTGGYQKPGDDQRVYRGGDPTDAATDNLYIDISSPAQRIYLNAGPEAPSPVIPVDFYVRFLVDSGATVELTYDLMNAGSSGYGYADLTMVVAAESLETSAIAAHAYTHEDGGTDEVTLAQSQVTDLTTDLAAKVALSGDTMTGQLNFSGTTHAGLKLLSITTFERDALAASAGMLIYNSTSDTVQKYEAGAWADVGSGGSGNGGYSLTASTSDATQTELLTAASARLTLPDNTAWGFTALFTGRYNGDGGSSFDTWTARATNQNWRGIASSSDGVKLVACASNGVLFTSTDSGVTWTERLSGPVYFYVASSSDGVNLVVTSAIGQIYTSTNSGVTWTARNSNRDWRGVASSSDGVKLVAVVNAGQIFTSTDSGVTWTARDSDRDWYAVASSSDGVKLLASTATERIYTSTDSGVTWTARDSVRPWQGVASSSDGVKLVACGGNYIWTSTDSGVSWTQRESYRNWQCVASSADGVRLAAGHYFGNLYTSSDSGVTWTARDTNRNWMFVTSSDDGLKLAACNYGGQIYTATSAASPATSSASETCEFKGQAVRDSGAASMSISALQENPIGTNTAGRFVCQADTTNGALQFLATGAASETWKWGVSVQTVEVTP